MVLTARHCVAAALESGKPIEAIFYGSGGDEVLEGAIIAESEELDACLLEISDVGDRTPVKLNSTLPREGSDWESFGFPLGKTIIGHRIFGKIAQLIDPPRLRIDMDLFVDPSASLEAYEGLSGAPLTSDGSGRALLRLQVDKTLGAVSIHALREFLVKNGVVVSAEADSHEQKQERLAERNAFQSKIETAIQKNLGRYLFLEGAHGMGRLHSAKHLNLCISD